MRRLKNLALAVAVSLVATLGYLGVLRASGNFHEVSRGQLYRAAQMDGQALARWKREYGIATVLNLRGKNDGKDWYETERAVADRLGIGHLDFKMSASRQLTREEVQQLLAVMQEAPKPLLIHCAAGADRTGLAAALYVAGVEGKGEEAAEEQLSLSYGHVGIPWVSAAWAMDETWEEIEPLLGFVDS